MTTEQRTDYYNELNNVQNHINNVDIDIVSFTAFMNDAEKLAHLEYYKKQCNK